MRINYLDTIKGMAIVLVILGHVLDGVIHAQLPLNATFGYLLYSFIYSFHMPVFFILSGMFFEHSFFKRGPVSFLKNKIITVLLVYYVWSFGQTVIEVILSRYTNNHIPVSSLITFLYEPRAQFWFLWDLFRMFLLTAAIYMISPRFGLIISCIVAALSFWIHHISGFVIVHDDYLYLLLGILLTKTKFRFGPVLILMFLVNISAVLLHIQLYWSAMILLGISGSVAMFSLGKVMQCKILDYMGRNSLPIYLMHVLATAAVRIALKGLHIVNPWIHIPLGTAAGVIVPLMIYHFYSMYRSKITIVR